MKMMKIMMAGLFLSASVLFTSCTEDDASPATGRVKLAVATTSSSTGNAAGRELVANELKFTGGTITIREIVFDGESTQSVSRTIEQIADINYATGNISPEIIVEVPAGEYRSVNLGIELQDDSNDPSVVIEGTYTNSNEEDIPVRFEFNSGEVFEANATSVMIEAGADIVGKITFDALDWFSVITAEELDNATLSAGVMVISETSNADIFDQVADRLDVATQAVFE
jgi:hypothetical protein